MAANAAECIAKVGKEGYFSPYVYAIFKAQDKIDNFEINKDTLTNLALDFGVNKNKFDSCLVNEKYSGKVESDIQKFYKEGAQGIPASFVYGPKNSKQTIEGAQTYDEVKRIIDSLLMK